ncbi:hypothetical protein BS78_02G118100 [Paspalum vaginatum]|nr:hypothetical protein BS78_02G118100 [Paspalum vaginatum]
MEEPQRPCGGALPGVPGGSASMRQRRLSLEPRQWRPSREPCDTDTRSQELRSMKIVYSPYYCRSRELRSMKVAIRQMLE